MKIKSEYQSPICDVVFVSMMSILQAPSQSNVDFVDFEEEEWQETQPE